MARILTEGFELGNLGAGYAVSSSNTPGITPNDKYGGARSLRYTGVYAWARWTGWTPLTEAFWRGAYNHLGGSMYYGTEFQLGDGSTGFSVQRWTPGSEYFYRIRRGGHDHGDGEVLATGTIIVNPDVWHVVEINWKVAEAGHIKVRIDGNMDAVYEGDTRWLGDGVTQIRVNGPTGYLDDVAINDTTGDIDNSWCGAGKVYCIPPSSDVIKGWTPSAGADNFAMVDDIPHDTDTTYVGTSENEMLDVYGFGAVPTILQGKIIQRVWAEGVVRKTESESAVGVKLGVISDEVTAEGSKQLLGVAYNAFRVKSDELVFNPGSGQHWYWEDLTSIRLSLKAVE